MNNIDYIEITISNTMEVTKISISTKELKAIINNKIKPITKEKIDNLQNIIEDWDINYQSPLLDAEKFRIKLIAKNRNLKTYQGSGKYPLNYDKLKKWISEIK